MTGLPSSKVIHGDKDAIWRRMHSSEVSSVFLQLLRSKASMITVMSINSAFESVNDCG